MCVEAEAQFLKNVKSQTEWSETQEGIRVVGSFTDVDLKVLCVVL